jgi:hypothetical protein
LAHGAAVTVHSHWFDVTGLTTAGLIVLAIHVLPWPKR